MPYFGASLPLLVLECARGFRLPQFSLRPYDTGLVFLFFFHVRDVSFLYGSLFLFAT